MQEFIMQPWPWWFSGILIGLTVPLLYILTGQAFGISTSLQQIGAMCSPGSKLSYFKDFNKRKGMWTLLFAIGIGIGGFARHSVSFGRTGRVFACVVSGCWRRDPSVGRWDSDWFRHTLRRRMYFRTCDHGYRESELAQSRRHDLFLRRWPGSDMGTGTLDFLT